MLAYVAYGLGSALRFVVQLMFSRTLGIVDFGRFVLARTWGETLASFADRGYGSAAVRLLPEYAASDRPRTYRWLLRRSVRATLVGGVGLSVAAVVAAVAAGVDQATLLVGLALVPLLATVRVLRGVLVAQHRLHTGNLVADVAQPVLMMALAWFAFVTWRTDAVVALVALALSLVAVVAAEVALIRRALPPLGADDGEPAPEHRSGLLGPMFVIQSTVVIYGASDVLITGAVLGPAAAGMYAAAQRVAALAGNVNNMVEGTAAPRLSAAWAQGDRRELQAIVDRSITTALVPTLALAAVCSAVGWFVLALFGPEFTDAYPVLVLLLVAGAVGASTGPSGNVLIQTDGHRLFAVIQGVLVGLHLPLAWVLASQLGLTGAAVSTVAVTTATNVTLTVAARRTRSLDVTPRWVHVRGGVAMLVRVSRMVLARVARR